MGDKKRGIFSDPPDESLEPYPGLFIGDPKNPSVPPFGDYDLRAFSKFADEKYRKTGEQATPEEVENFRKTGK